ncbi:hypothetical protein [Methylorubrum extorquens]|uniref:hypothetical protein n=1 Tax=Methylorubrum extorquens TaxID=408 RepID=UPI0012DB7A8A|nr:hypothetical protein [Methylorubrum extorquens]
MSRTILTTLFLASLGAAVSTLPSAAMPVASAMMVGSNNADLTQVRMSRHSMRHRRMRSRSSGGNANMPSRPPGAKQYGQTTGGPRRR